MQSEIRSRVAGDLPIGDAAEAAATIGSAETVLVSGFGSTGYPKAVPLALVHSNRDLSLTIGSGGSVGKEIDSELVGADAVERRFLYQARPETRSRANDGRIAFHDRNVSQFADDIQYGGICEPDTAVVEAVAVGPDWFVPSTSIGHTPAIVEAADRLIVEVNEAQPLSLSSIHDCYRLGEPPNREPIPLTSPDERIGSHRISFDPEKLDFVVKTDHPDDPYTFRDATEADLAIARNLTEFLSTAVSKSSVFDDTVHVQFGVGSLGNALMKNLDNADFDDRDLVYYGEVIMDGLLDMIDAGKLSCASATSLALSDEGQSRLFDDIEQYAESVVLRPANVSNARAVIERFGVVAVNSALEIDIYGHVNSTHVGGTDVLNGVGGSPDFVGNALLSVIALPSRTADGEISRVVPMVPHVDHTEHDIDVVVTEQGVADLRGCSPRERAMKIIQSCSHPEYRPDLRAYFDRAKQGGGHVPHDLETALSHYTDSA